MGDGVRNIKIIQDYFQDSASDTESLQQQDSFWSATGGDDPLQEEEPCTPRSGIASEQQVSTSQLNIDTPPSFLSSFCSSLGDSYQWTRRQLRTTPSSMMKFLSLRGIPFIGVDGEEKVEISSVELESLRSELADLEEREAHLKAQFEHLDEILRGARLSGYLYIRTRWTALPGEPPPIDDGEVDDWLPRFVVLQGPCLFFYLSSKDLSPQDSALLSDITEMGPLPNIKREDGEVRYCFYILTKCGLRFECSSASKIRLDSWLTVLREDSNMEDDDDSIRTSSKNEICT